MLEVLEYMKNSDYDEVIFTCRDSEGLIDVHVDYREDFNNTIFSDYLDKSFYNVDELIKYCYDNPSKLD